MFITWCGVDEELKGSPSLEHFKKCIKPKILGQDAFEEGLL